VSISLGSECLRVAKEAALSVGKSLFLPNYWKPTEEKRVDIKDGNASNLVTETDRRIQFLIHAKLKEAFPTFR
jgi:3'-phosphoadenosine 5'-phosphosulfate (PAPS) 3'-phosphatase